MFKNDMLELLSHLVKRVDSLERRLDDRVQTTFNCNTETNNVLFLELGLEKRLPAFLRHSPALTPQITDNDIDQMMDVIKTQIIQQLFVEKGFVEFVVYRVEGYNYFDVCVRLHAYMNKNMDKHDKIKVYENVERGFKLQFGNVFTITPYAQNKYDAYKLHVRKQFTF